MTDKPYGADTATTYGRRRFLQGVIAVGAASGASAVISACAPLDPTLADSTITPHEAPVMEPTPDSGMARVAFVKTTDRADGVRRAMALLDPIDWASKHVLIKPNFNSADPAPGSTHPDVLSTVITALNDGQAGDICIADRSGMGDTRGVMAQLGVDQVAKEMGCQLVAFDDLAVEDWEIVDFEGSHWKQGFAFPRMVNEADAVVQLCCLKTHRYGGHFTLSLKNSVGLAAKFVPGDSYNYMSELHTSSFQRTMIAEINAAYSPDLVILDGVEAFVTGGPDSGEQVDAHVMLAGSDRVALDAVGVALLRHFGATAEVSKGAIFEQEQIARAVELGLGVAGPEQIELVTDDAESEAFADEITAVLRAG